MRLLRLFICLLFISVDAADIDSLKIWPLPNSVSYGSGDLYLSNNFVLETKGSKFVDDSGILESAFLRTINIIEADHIIEAKTSEIDPALVLRGIHVVIGSPSDELQYGVDESYTLSIPSQLQKGINELDKLRIPSKQSPLLAKIEAPTVYGALHALQTFSQICVYDIIARGILIHRVPWTIIDQPRFPFRGLLIDTSRHYQPVPVIKKVIDSMVYAKLNVLHWHIVDEESFPLEIPSYPKLWDGSYSKAERYTFSDAAEIVSYAKNRGVNVLAEIDVPGHGRSWGVGYPSLWPSANCQEPLDVSNEFTFELINGILSDFSKIFKYKFVHLGGDEVDTSCWVQTPHVRAWLEKNGLTGPQAYEYFVLRAQQIGLSHGYEIINWEETFNNFGGNLSRKTVVQNWLGSNVAPRVVKAGLRCLVSNQDKWYLDHLDNFWQGFYSNEPLTNITDSHEQKLVIGGEVCMWGEHVDVSDIEQTIWPRAAAAAERLWTSYDNVAKDPEQVLDRLSYFRCLLNQRGVAAAPLEGPGRTVPSEPGSCYLQ